MGLGNPKVDRSTHSHAAYAPLSQSSDADDFLRGCTTALGKSHKSENPQFHFKALLKTLIFLTYQVAIPRKEIVWRLERSLQGPADGEWRL